VPAAVAVEEEDEAAAGESCGSKGMRVATGGGAPVRVSMAYTSAPPSPHIACTA
jgi:hypothetical protein